MKTLVVWLVTYACIGRPVWGRLGTNDDEHTARFLKGLSEDENGHVNVIVGLKKDQMKDALDKFKRSIAPNAPDDDTPERGAGLKRVNAASVKLTKQEIKTLLKRGDIEYIEEDYPVYLDSSSIINNEIVPYGVTLSQSYDPGTLAYQSFSNSSTGACNDPSSIKIAIIDSGADVNHPDLPCRDIQANDTNCIGKEFGVTGETWYSPLNPHGTHVFGIIGAKRNNDLGIIGQVTESNVCYMHAQIFGADGSSKNSAVIDAVEWAVGLGATIINMSLGSPTVSISAKQYFAVIRAQGVLVVSAAGNDGTTQLHCKCWRGVNMFHLFFRRRF
jgi:hypothetical protein